LQPALPEPVTAARNDFESKVGSNDTAHYKFGRGAGTATPIWNEAITKPLTTGAAVFVPVRYDHPYPIATNLARNILFNINQLQWLVICPTLNHGYTASVITYYPDSSYSALSAFTGIIRQENWNGEFMASYKFEKGGKVRKLVSSSNPASRQSSASNNLLLLQVCYRSFGYNYMASDPETGYYWEMDLGCDNLYVSDFSDGNGGNTFADTYGPNWEGGGVGGFGGASSFTVVNGDNPIANVKDYIRCFDNIAGTKTYHVTICVDQPNPGVRDTWGVAGTSSSATGNPVSTGHTFLVLSETGFNGTITRNVGFYPKYLVSPTQPVSQGQLNNDAEHNYNISLTLSVTNSEFFQMLDFVNDANQPGYNYDLNSNNCTNFAINTLGAAGISIPARQGTWPGGKGFNPGDFGEDIRAMTLGPNMTRNTTFNDHPNLGNCY